MDINVKHLGLVPYETTWQAMRAFTDERGSDTLDELWLVEHPPVFTQGLNGKPEHILHSSDIPIVQTDRGGQITYHAPGQAIVYVLFDLKRAKLGVRALVNELENSIIDYLQQFEIDAAARSDAPGVYVEGQKIASLGLKIRKQRSYHGLSFNVDMNLAPFQLVNPCGLAGMQMTQLKDWINANSVPTAMNAAESIAHILKQRLQKRIQS